MFSLSLLAGFAFTAFALGGPLAFFWPWRRRLDGPARDSRQHIIDKGSEVEQRVAAALRRAPVPVRVADAEVSVEPVQGYVIHRTTETLCLELEEEGDVDPGTVLSVRPVGADVSVPWVKVVVERRRQTGGCWNLDCKYAPLPPFSVRMLFG